MKSNEALVDDVIKLSTEYNIVQLKIRESNEIIKRKLDNVFTKIK